MIDFRAIRSDSKGQASSFEQLVCELARLEGGNGDFRRIDGAGGDGGVEALRLLPDGSCIGYQAKFLINKLDWKQIDKSVVTALEQHPNLERYIVAVPRDFTGRKAASNKPSEGQWGEWDKHVFKWKKLAGEKGMTVDFQPWNESDLKQRLLKPEAHHLLNFFFKDHTIFTRHWLAEKHQRTLRDLGTRYRPRTHVKTEAEKAFEIIFHGESVSTHLRSIFELAASSQPRAALQQVPPEAGFQFDLAPVETALSEFQDLAEVLEQSSRTSADTMPQPMNPWPVSAWFHAWGNMMNQLNYFHEALRRSAAQHDTDEMAHLTKYHDLGRPEVFGGRWAQLLPVEATRAALFVSKTGWGKSHSLARASETALKKGWPVIHILGQDIIDLDPRESICRVLGLGHGAFSTVLSALNLAAEAGGTRAMLVVDALNEGREGIAAWSQHLKSFVQEVANYSRLFLIMSCREEYLHQIFREEGLMAARYPYGRQDRELLRDEDFVGKFVRVDVSGFSSRSEREEALRTYCEEYKIPRPAVPLMNHEFYTPLVLSSICSSLRPGDQARPGSYAGASQIWKFILAAKVGRIGTPHDGSKIFSTVNASLQVLANAMFAADDDRLPRGVAHDLLEQSMRIFPLVGRSWLDALEGVDILSPVSVYSDLPAIGGEDARPVRFSFQRYQDHLLAEHFYVNDLHSNASSGDESIWGRLLRRTTDEQKRPTSKPRSKWEGMLGALWSLVAEKEGRELWDLPGFWAGPESANDRYYARDFRPVFKISIQERSPKAFSQRTLELFRVLWKDKLEEKNLLLLSTCCVPGHPWNIDLLEKRLLVMKNVEREKAWDSQFSQRYGDLHERAMDIVDWSQDVTLAAADDSIPWLLVRTLVCLSLVSDQELSEKAAAGAGRVIQTYPDLAKKVRQHYPADARDFHKALARSGLLPPVLP